MTWVFVEVERHTGGDSHVETGRDWSDVSTRQGMPRLASKHWRLERGKEGPSRAFRESMAL